MYDSSQSIRTDSEESSEHEDHSQVTYSQAYQPAEDNGETDMNASRLDDQHQRSDYGDEKYSGKYDESYSDRDSGDREGMTEQDYTQGDYTQ